MVTKSLSYWKGQVVGITALLNTDPLPYGSHETDLLISLIAAEDMVTQGEAELFNKETHR